MAIYGGTLGGGNAWMKIMGIGDPSARKKKGNNANNTERDDGKG
jgi:hypothetical protein